MLSRVSDIQENAGPDLYILGIIWMIKNTNH
jgi:hypothetical protein